MSVNYVCRHCQTLIGRLDNKQVNESLLGFHFLTPEERQDIISYDPNGDTTVKVVCDYCKEALDANPELSLVTSPLQ
ncbi:anti-sigma-F factor Fin family protein [Paenibacillus thalictri]|uniref:Anti-sigma-F factor Fin family protein n=1 Tax=Paenibacillus thalictri TaxID=2527873 RepID=A0A4Q9DGL3_9BACL|nr:anti-sigma-F factor Fin family protein [Paenibacillus thalictri]TBL69020.1 anti-sigma-F factor Fin family protein [Paenibacillus thalictri]